MRDGIGRKELQLIRRRFTNLHKERLRHIEKELRPSQQDFIELLAMRSGQQSYPLYLTSVELSGPSPGQEGSIIEILQLKKRLESRLNQALNELQGDDGLQSARDW